MPATISNGPSCGVSRRPEPAEVPVAVVDRFGAVDPDIAAVATSIAERHPAVRLIVLHGSRARGDAFEGSDWDLGYLADTGVDHLGLLGEFVAFLGTDDVDLVELDRASSLLRFGAAADGRCLYQRPGEHQSFVLGATLFWCDVEAVIRRAAAGVLTGLET